MPRFQRRRRAMRMAPINSVKNQHATKQTILASALIIEEVAVAVDVGAPTKVTGLEVPVGAKVFSVDLSVNFISVDSSTSGNFDWCFLKLREGQTVASLITNPDWTNLGFSNGRNQIIKSYMANYGTEDAGSIRYNPHIKIPKIYQRMRAGDSLVMAFIASSAGSLSSGMRYKYFN